MEIVPATADRWDSLARLFERDSGSDPRWCWCMYWRHRAADFATGSAARNRAEMETLVRDGPPPGLLAVEDGRVVGWMAFGPRVDSERIVRSKRIPQVDDRPAWAITCFVVARDRRGQGVTRALLRGAVDRARSAGIALLEAYPVDPSNLPGGRVAPPQGYTGTVATFLGEGFEVVAPTSAQSGGAPRVVVRLELAGDA